VTSMKSFECFVPILFVFSTIF